METPRDDDPDRPDDIDQAEEALDSSKFGEHDDDRQEKEWEEDAAEGGEKD